MGVYFTGEAKGLDTDGKVSYGDKYQIVNLAKLLGC